MSTQNPRIPPITPSEITERSQEFLTLVEGPGGRKGGSHLNVVLTLARHPDLAIPYFQFGRYILGASTLSGRLREIATLRTAWLYNSNYEWTKHAVGGRKEGMTEDEIAATKIGPTSPVWTDALERSVVSAADQLKSDTSIDDATWAVLAEHLNDKQLMDLLFTIGQYAMLAMVLNGARVQMEAE